LGAKFEGIEESLSTKILLALFGVGRLMLVGGENGWSEKGVSRDGGGNRRGSSSLFRGSRGRHVVAERTRRTEGLNCG
jgi:hypothetical protein